MEELKLLPGCLTFAICRSSFQDVPLKSFSNLFKVTRNVSKQVTNLNMLTVNMFILTLSQEPNDPIKRPAHRAPKVYKNRFWLNFSSLPFNDLSEHPQFLQGFREPYFFKASFLKKNKLLQPEGMTSQLPTEAPSAGGHISGSLLDTDHSKFH